MTDAPQELPVQLQFTLPDALEGGEHADIARVWQMNESFIFDFASLIHPPAPVQDEQGQAFMLVQAKVVSRVRLDASQLESLIALLQEQHKAYQENRNRMILNQRLEDLVGLPGQEESGSNNN